MSAHTPLKPMHFNPTSLINSAALTDSAWSLESSVASLYNSVNDSGEFMVIVAAVYVLSVQSSRELGPSIRYFGSRASGARNFRCNLPTWSTKRVFQHSSSVHPSITSHTRRVSAAELEWYLVWHVPPRSAPSMLAITLTFFLSRVDSFLLSSSPCKFSQIRGCSEVTIPVPSYLETGTFWCGPASIVSIESI